MTRTGALVWKEWRDHRAAVFVFAALVPLVSWPVQRWTFRFAEPDWTWKWIIPLCVGLAVAVVAADSFAMDLATSRMTSFAALPVPLRRHFGARTLFLALVAAAMCAWTAATNLAIVGWWGKPDAVALHVDAYGAAGIGLLMTAAATGAVLVFSSLGVGGFRAVLGGVVLAAVAFVATDYADDRFFALPAYNSAPLSRLLLEWTVAAVVLFAAAYAGFVGGRAHAASRKRGAALVVGILVAAFGLPAGAASLKVYRDLMLTPTDPDIRVEFPVASPDGRYVAVRATKQGRFGTAHRSWIVRVEDSAVFDWPRRNEFAQGWTEDGLVWAISESHDPKNPDWGRFARPETGETASAAARADLDTRLADGLSIGPRWAQWLRWGYEPSKAKLGSSVYRWTLRTKDGEPQRAVEARSAPTPTTTVGEALIVTPDKRLALVDLAGGEPRVVAEDVEGISGVLAASSDGRYFVVRTTKGGAVLDSTTWKRVFEFGRNQGAFWCVGRNAKSVLQVENGSGMLLRLVDVSTGREIVPDPTLGVRGWYRSVEALPDGRFVALNYSNRLLLLDADGKFIRRLFPPEE